MPNYQLVPSTAQFFGKKASNETVADETDDAINWDKEQVDPAGWHDDVTNNTRITVDTSGWYLVNVRFRCEERVANNASIRLYVNGTEVDRQARTTAATNDDTTYKWIGELTAGDYIESNFWHNSNNNVQVGGGETDHDSRIYVTRLPW